MKSALKAGFIASIVAAVTHTFMAWIGYLFLALGFEEYVLGPFWWTIFNLLWSIVWFTLWGIVYSKVYDVIPGKGVWKGLIFALITYLMFPIAFSIYTAIGYGDMLYAIAWFVAPIYSMFPFGLTIGYLYKKE